MGWNKPFIKLGPRLMIVWGWFLKIWIIPLPIHWVSDHRQNSGLEVPTKKYLFNSGITQLYLKKINCCQGSTHPQAPPFFFWKTCWVHPATPQRSNHSWPKSVKVLRWALQDPIGVWRGTLLSSKIVMVGHAKCTKVSQKNQGLSVERD